MADEGHENGNANGDVPEIELIIKVSQRKSHFTCYNSRPASISLFLSHLLFVTWAWSGFTFPQENKAMILFGF